MIQHHSTLKLIFGYEPCFTKNDKGEFREYPTIFDVKMKGNSAGTTFEKSMSTIHQKNSFWRHFSERIWSFDDFTFIAAPAAVSLLTGALRYKLWYSPMGVYKVQCMSVLFPHVPPDLNKKANSKDNRGIGDLLRQQWFTERFDYFEKYGKFNKVPNQVNNESIFNHKFYMLLKECSEQGAWTDEAWKEHCNFLVECSHYHNNVVSIMQHEMLHIMWEHLLRMNDRDPMLHNIATDYAINQQLPFTNDLKKILITDENEDFFTKFVTGVAKWRAKSSSKDLKELKKIGLDLNSPTEKFAKKHEKLCELFVHENGVMSGFAQFFSGVSKASSKNKYIGKDSDFYYDILELVKDDLNNNGDGGTIDDHTMWEKSDEQQKAERQGNGKPSEDGKCDSEDGDGEDESKEGKGKGKPKDGDSTSSNGSKSGDKGQIKPKVSNSKKASVTENNDSKEESEGEPGSPDKSAQDGDQISLGEKGRSIMRGGYEHPGWKNIIGRQESKNAFRAAATASGYNPDDPEDLERAINDIPGLSPLREMFHEWFSVKTKNWKKELRAFLRSCIRPSDLEYTMMREHRALDDTFPGKKRDIGFDVILGLDTSGSISAEDFNDFIGQIHRMSNDCDFDRVRIIQCHSRISSDKTHRVKSARRLKELFIAETGGTQMQPVFELLKREGNKKPLILFTDGYIDDFLASTYPGYKHIMFLSRGNSGQRKKLESNGFKVLCQDDS